MQVGFAEEYRLDYILLRSDDGLSDWMREGCPVHNEAKECLSLGFNVSSNSKDMICGGILKTRSADTLCFPLDAENANRVAAARESLCLCPSNTLADSELFNGFVLLASF